MKFDSQIFQKKPWVAVLASLGISFIVIVFVAHLNELNSFGSDSNSKSQVNFDVKNIKKKKVAKIKKVKKKVNKKAKALKRRAKPNLKTALAGSSFGLDLFNLDLSTNDGLGKNLNDLVMTEDSVDTKPMVRERAPLSYPAEAKARGIKGFVTMRLLINMKGRVEKVRVEEAAPSGVFDQVAIDSVKRWLYRPAEYQGEPVRVWAQQTIRFAFE